MLRLARPIAPRRSVTGAIAPLLAALAIAAPAAASGDEAWAEFRTAVEEACRAQLAEVAGDVTIVVNPFGSESYGAAVVSVATSGGSDRMICIYDKSTRIAEVTAPFAADR